jgi:hypothetical protein
MKIILAITISITCVTSMTAQNNDNLRRLWELIAIERLEPVMFGSGEEIGKIDLRHPTNIFFGDGVSYDSITYEVVGEEIELFDKDKNSLSKEVGWMIEKLSDDELSLLIVAKPEANAFIRLKYRARD